MMHGVSFHILIASTSFSGFKKKEKAVTVKSRGHLTTTPLDSLILMV